MSGCHRGSGVRGMPTIGRRGVCALIFSFKFLQHVDMGVPNGSPLEIMTFVEQTTHDTKSQSVLFAYVSSATTIGVLSGCILSVLLLGIGMRQHVLMKWSIYLWVLGILISGFCKDMPSVPSSYFVFLTARALVGVGAGCLTNTWPSYVELLARSGERSLYMTIIEVGTALVSVAYPLLLPLALALIHV